MTSVKRLNYSTGQFLTAADFQLEQNYHRSLRRLHHKYMHTPGVAGGLDVTGTNGSTQVVVAPGLALDANGAEIALIDPFTIDLSGRSDSGWFLITANYSEFDAAGDTGTAGAANIYLRRTEQPNFVLFAVDGPVSLKPATAGGPVPTPGIQIGIAAIQLNAGKLAAINSAAPARQQAGSRLDPATTLAGLKVGGDTSLAGLSVSGTANFAGASSFTGAAGFASLNASGDVALGGKLSVAGNTVVGANQTRTWFSVGGGLDNELHVNPALAIRNPNPLGISNGTEFSQGQDNQNCATFYWTPDSSAINVSNGKPLLLQANAGKVGIGTSAPRTMLDVNGPIRGAGMVLEGPSAYGLLQVGTQPTNTGIDGWQIGALTVNGETVVHGRLTVLGTIMVSGGKGGYVVDNFVNRIGGPVEIGDVVVIESSQPAYHYGLDNLIPVPEIDLARTACDTRVCGIVCDVHGELLDASSGQPRPRIYTAEERAGLDATVVQPGQIGNMVTLGAFAQCKVDADIAAIAAGDLLTTSPTPGHAQKVLDRSQAIGAIIGKALAPLASGCGKIPVMVLLQ